MKKIALICLVVAASIAAVIPASAHHGYAAYDLTKTITVKGTATEVDLVNPHSTIFFDVKDEKGRVEHWVAEAGHIRLMRELGWTPDTVKPGDTVTFYYHPAKNGAHTVDLVKVELADGRVFNAHSTNGVNTEK